MGFMISRSALKSELKVAADLVAEHLFDEGGMGIFMERLPIVSYIRNEFGLSIDDSMEVTRIAGKRYGAELKSAGYGVYQHSQNACAIIGPVELRENNIMAQYRRGSFGLIK